MGEMAGWIIDHFVIPSDELYYGAEEEEMEKHTFNIAGVQFHQYREVLNEIQGGDQLELVMEPTNKYDPNAIRIHYPSLEHGKEIMLGYVPAKKSAEVSALLQVSETVTCELVEFIKTAKPWEMFKVEITGE